jgi:hypothetical protein
MKKVIAVITFLFIGLPAMAQRVVPFIAWSCADVRRPVADHSATNIYLKENGTTLVIKSHGGKTTMPITGVWGYRGRNKALHRLVDGVDYTVCGADTISLYMRRVHAGRIRKKQYYFSEGLCGKLYPLTVENLCRVYNAANPQFVSTIKDKWKWYRYLNSYDRGNQTYRVVALYKKTIS